MRFVLISLFLFASILNAQQIYVLKAARLFDGKSDSIVQPGIVVVSGDKILAVGGSIPAGATVIDLGDTTLLPGFIDAHTHLTMDFDPDYNGARVKALSRTVAEQALSAAQNASQDSDGRLYHSSRMSAPATSSMSGLRNSINKGVTVGPRMLVSVHALGRDRRTLRWRR